MGLIGSPPDDELVGRLARLWRCLLTPLACVGRAVAGAWRTGGPRHDATDDAVYESTYFPRGCRFGLRLYFAYPLVPGRLITINPIASPSSVVGETGRPALTKHNLWIQTRPLTEYSRNLPGRLDTTYYLHNCESCARLQLEFVL